jgi:hypothetical protein
LEHGHAQIFASEPCELIEVANEVAPHNAFLVGAKTGDNLTGQYEFCRRCCRRVEDAYAAEEGGRSSFGDPAGVSFPKDSP